MIGLDSTHLFLAQLALKSFLLHQGLLERCKLGQEKLDEVRKALRETQAGVVPGTRDLDLGGGHGPRFPYSRLHPISLVKGIKMVDDWETI